MTFYKWNELQGKQKGCDLSAEVQVVVDKTDFESGHITFRIKKNKEKKKSWFGCWKTRPVVEREETRIECL